ncbi:alpha/beta fold hydrolase [Amycolatopsis cihanbeyliensis]|uniref:Pimeloyl-ACP methyl ester carboxylesterase n=1 Tax=Amycolatopsis cihanbeyliensis TaxID=1128664 RepID=A0A542DEN9_AMYCI|nr:alpha/beta hydrolase [Amycolatopsis cihanbeyliensis]TQJ01520.1 pimeloyl-ACP methyl ester carboxylesterase [Amycolatopsis cihanbeyliensis]
MDEDLGRRDPRLGPAKHVRLPAGTVRYHDIGDGPVLVFVHGYLVNADIWRELVPLLADRFRCITPDWPLGSHVSPMRREADLSPPGIARLVADLLDALDLRGVTLIGNDSGGAYSQLATANHPERIGRLVLNSCETPWCSWPPGPGGFGLLKLAARHPATHRCLYQPLRLSSAWRLPNTYGSLAKYPIEDRVMRGYVRPVLENGPIRFDGRKAIGGVSARFIRQAAQRIPTSFPGPVLCLWAAEDRVFPPEHGKSYAERLGASSRTVDDSFTYTAEDQPERMAAALREWLEPRR